MTTATSIPVPARPRLPTLPLLGRLSAGVLVLLAFVLASGALLQQRSLLWQRLPATAVDRFVPDAIVAPLPALPALRELARACARPLDGWTLGRRAAMRHALAECLADPAALVQGDAATQANAAYDALLDRQLAAADAWLAEFAQRSDSVRADLVRQLDALRGNGNEARREPVGRAEAVDQAATTLRQRAQATRSARAALALRPAAEKLRGLALLATGLQTGTDFGHTPPALQLETDRGSLADALEWQRKARGFMQRGFDLGALQQLPSVLLASTALLLGVAAVVLRLRAVPLALVAGAGLLLAAGALLLTDLALTGAPALRYLAERQFLRFPLGDAMLPLTLAVPLPFPVLDHTTLTLWTPLLAAALALVLLSRLRDGRGVLLAPLRGWLALSASPRLRLVPMAALVASGVAAVLLLGMPAAVSELLILLGTLGLATVLARQAPLANTGAGLGAGEFGLVAAALVCAIGGALWRGDLGHALVAAMLAASFAWLFGHGWLRVALLLGAAAGVAALGLCLAEGALVGPLAELAAHLPPHAQDRLQAQFDPFHAAASDLARVRWLIDSAGPGGSRDSAGAAAGGWGLGYVPWQGLAPAGAQDGLPLQGPSDYVLALVSAVWGRAGGLALMGAVLALFVAAGALGLRTALRAAMPPALRALASVGAFGCLVMAFKVLLSVGGVSGVLPLTGLPVALVGYGPVTHLAALGYLVLVLGTAHLEPVEALRGVRLRAAAGPAGAVRRRGRLFVIAGAVGLVLLLAVGARHLGAGLGPQGERHVARARLELAQAVARAIVPRGDVASSADAAGAGATPACPELGAAIDAWNQRLATLARPVRVAGDGASAAPDANTSTALRLDPQRLHSAAPADSPRECRRFARTLGQMLTNDFARLVGSQAAVPAEAQRLHPFERPRALGARPSDYTTGNPWWGLPGCLLPVDAFDTGAAAAQADCRASNAAITPRQLDADWLTDAWLQRELAPQLIAATRQPVGHRMLNQREVATGPALGLTLEPKLQGLAQQLADCYTGRLRGSDCSAVLPADAARRERHFGAADALRAGALGLVLVDVRSGRVVALAGSVSDCALDQLGRVAEPDAQGRVAALRAGQRCAQLPDRRSAWLGLQHPALWMVPPGSSLKELALVAGIDSGLVAETSDAAWKRILAESHERLPVQRVALAAGQHYLDVLGAVGYGRAPADLMWGGAAAANPGTAAGPVRWAPVAYAGSDGLRPTTMTLDEAERIRREKEAGVDADRLHGATVMREFVAARRLADAALGGGDIRVNALGLASLWRSLDLRAGGAARAPATHLLERPGAAVPNVPTDWASAAAARRVLGMTSGVTASAWGGTAQGSCRVVFGRCAAQGVPGLSGKTGTSDFLSVEDGPHVKAGLQVPAKLFAGVFTGADGRRYAVAATALRVREGASRTLELQASAPAEAALTLMREMGVKALD